MNSRAILILLVVLGTNVEARPRILRHGDPQQNVSVQSDPAVPDQEQLEVDAEQVLRLGSCVQHCDGLHRSSPTSTDSFVDLMSAVPPDDDHKWFVSVFVDGSVESQYLREQWKTDRHLLALADPTDQSSSWSHFHFYNVGDGSQKKRIENLKFDSLPTVIVQPPRSGEFGNPETVVYQSGYSGDPVQLANSISESVQFYITRLEDRPGYDTFRAQTPVEEQNDTIGNPPWDLPSAEEDARRRPRFPDGLPRVPPREQIEVLRVPWGLILTAITGGATVPVLVGIGLWLVRVVRSRRKAEGKRLFLDDETLERLLDMVEGYATPNSEDDKDDDVESKPKPKKKRRRR